MSRRATDTILDPALAVSGLLTRLGLFLLVVPTPLVAMASRRAVSVLVPIAAAMLMLAAGLDGRLGLALVRFGRILLLPAGLAVMVLLGWAGFSLSWTPAVRMAPGHLSGLVLALALFAATIACVAERVRGSDVNLIPVGVAIAAVVLTVEVALGPEPRILNAQRAALLIALLAWPGFTALMVRRRTWMALVLGALVLVVLWQVHDLVVLAGFLAGLVIFLVAQGRPDRALLLLGTKALGLLAFAPVIGSLMAEHGGRLLPRDGDELMAIWRDVTHSLWIQPVGGFGFDASLGLVRGPGGALLGSPRNAALQIWLELGLVGVGLSGLAIALGCLAVRRLARAARPPVLAAMTVALVAMFSGLASWQVWWVMMLGLTAISLAFVSRRVAREAS